MLTFSATTDELGLYLGDHPYLNSSSFDGQSLSHFGRPVRMSVMRIEGQNGTIFTTHTTASKWSYLSEKAFKGYFASHPNNTLHIDSEYIDCNDSRNQWFVKDSEIMSRISDLSINKHSMNCANNATNSQ